MLQKEVFILTHPDNEHYTQRDAHEAISRLAGQCDIAAAPTGRTRDQGHGLEEEFIFEGAEGDIAAFEDFLKAELA